MGNEMSALDTGMEVSIEPDAEKLRQAIEACEDLEWDEDTYLPTLGKEGKVIEIDDDGLHGVLLNGAVDAVYYSRAALIAKEEPLPPPPDMPRSQNNSILSNIREIKEDIVRSIPTGVSEVKEKATNFGRKVLVEEGRVANCLLFTLFDASFNGFLLGYVFRIFDATRHMMFVGDPTLKLITPAQETTMSVVTWTIAALAGLLAGFLTKLGRKGLAVVSCGLFITGEVMCAGSRNVETMVFGKVFTGLSLGLITTLTPLYLSEIAPRNRRGMFVMLFCVMISLGELFATVAALHYDSMTMKANSDWRWMLGLVVAPACVHFIMLLKLPESPLLLAKHGNVEEALRIARSLNPGSEKLVEEVQHSCRLADQQSVSRRARHYWGLFTRHKSSATTGMLLQLLHQVLHPRFTHSPSDKVWAYWGSGEDATPRQRRQLQVALTGVSFVVTLISVIFVHHCSRRRLLLSSLAGVCAAMVVLGLGVHGDDSFMSFLGLGLLYLLYPTGLGCIPWIYNSEAHPLRYREVGMGAATFTFYIAKLVMERVRTPLEDMGAGKYFLLTVIGIVMLVFFYFRMPESGLISVAHRQSAAIPRGSPCGPHYGNPNETLIMHTSPGTASSEHDDETELVPASHRAEPLFSGLNYEVNDSMCSNTSAADRKPKGGFRKKQRGGDAPVSGPSNGSQLFDGLNITVEHSS